MAFDSSNQHFVRRSSTSATYPEPVIFAALVVDIVKCRFGGQRRDPNREQSSPAVESHSGAGSSLDLNRCEGNRLSELALDAADSKEGTRSGKGADANKAVGNTARRLGLVRTDGCIRHCIFGRPTAEARMGAVDRPPGEVPLAGEVKAQCSPAGFLVESRVVC